VSTDGGPANPDGGSPVPPASGDGSAASASGDGSGTTASGGIPALAARDITKRFPGIVANDHVTLEILPGEVHTLLGENGAGKTTLCNVLTGQYRPDDGHVEVRGKAVRFRSPRDAHASGIFLVHQHFRLVQIGRAHV